MIFGAKSCGNNVESDKMIGVAIYIFLMLPMQKTICKKGILVIGDMIHCVLAEKSGTQSVRQKNFEN